jgi:hypothetical protein
MWAYLRLRANKRQPGEHDHGQRYRDGRTSSDYVAKSPANRAKMADGAH